MQGWNVSKLSQLTWFPVRWAGSERQDTVPGIAGLVSKAEYHPRGALCPLQRPRADLQGSDTRLLMKRSDGMPQEGGCLVQGAGDQPL